MRVNLTDGDVKLVMGRHGVEAGYNTQAMVSPIDPAKAEVDGYVKSDGRQPSLQMFWLLRMYVLNVGCAPTSAPTEI